MADPTVQANRRGQTLPILAQASPNFAPFNNTPQISDNSSSFGYAAQPTIAAIQANSTGLFSLENWKESLTAAAICTFALGLVVYKAGEIPVALAQEGRTIVSAAKFTNDVRTAIMITTFPMNVMVIGGALLVCGSLYYLFANDMPVHQQIASK